MSCRLHQYQWYHIVLFGLGLTSFVANRTAFQAHDCSPTDELREMFLGDADTQQRSLLHHLLVQDGARQ